MKKYTLILLLFMAAQLLKAQLPNAGFETLNPNGTIKNWGAFLLSAVILDSLGNPTDSLIIDNNYYFSSNDAHTGTKALEMRNAYWKNSGDKIAGRARLTMNDSDYFMFSVPVPLNQYPLDFSFYYKFFPVNNDTAYAWLRLTDISSNIVGEADIYLQGIHSNYTQAITPIIYTGSTAPAFVEIGFINAKPYSEANYGTRLLIDDVNFSSLTTGISTPRLPEHALSCFPNPAEKEVNLRLKNYSDLEPMYLKLIDSGGSHVQNLVFRQENGLIKINTETLPSGLYFINMIHAGYTYSARFVK